MNSLEEKDYSSDSFETLLSNDDANVSHTKVPMTPHGLTEEEIQSNCYRREHAKYFVQLCLRTNNCEPNNAKVKAYLDL